LALIGLVTWLAWPLSETEIHARAQEAMQSDEETVREMAHEKYIVPYLEDYPDGEFLADMQDWDVRIRVDRLERQLNVAIARNRESKSEAERLLMDAQKYESVGDRLTALSKYRDMTKLMKVSEDKDAALFVKLAERRIQAIEDEGTGAGDGFQFVNEKLRQADELRLSGKPIEAEEIWRIIEKTYGANREFALQVSYARARLNGEEPPELDLSPPPNDE